MSRRKKYPVYIPSKSRSATIAKTLESWAACTDEVVVNLVVEPQDADDYENALWDADLDDVAQLRVLGGNDQGISFARNGVVDFAREDNAEGFIMSDDDLRVEPGISALARFAEKKSKASGCGFTHRLHLFWAGVEFDTGAHPTAGGTSQNCVGLAVSKMDETNGYHSKLGPYEDSEIILQLTKAGYGPWYQHTDAKGALVGQRYQPGGIAETENRKKLNRAEREEHFMRTLASEHGQEYFGWHKASKHIREMGVERVVRFRWRRIYRDFNPRAYQELYTR